MKNIWCWKIESLHVLSVALSFLSPSHVHPLDIYMRGNLQGEKRTTETHKMRRGRTKNLKRGKTSQEKKKRSDEGGKYYREKGKFLSLYLSLSIAENKVQQMKKWVSRDADTHVSLTSLYSPSLDINKNSFSFEEQTNKYERQRIVHAKSTPLSYSLLVVTVLDKRPTYIYKNINRYIGALAEELKVLLLVLFTLFSPLLFRAHARVFVEPFTPKSGSCSFDW